MGVAYFYSYHYTPPRHAGSLNTSHFRAGSKVWPILEIEEPPVPLSREFCSKSVESLDEWRHLGGDLAQN